MLDKTKARIPGVVVCAVVACVATWLGSLLEIVGAPVFAILLGMVMAPFLSAKRRVPLTAGVAFTSKIVLQAAVVLLGFGLSLGAIVAVGAQSLPVIVSTVATSLAVAFVLCRVMRIPGRIVTLVGVGSSICGGSAIAATAPVIKANEEEVAQAISVIFFFNVIAALVFPSLGGLLGLSDGGFALFAGTAVNDTSSVTAAAAAWDGMHPGATTLDDATIVKLTRTLAIVPITLVLALWTARREAASAPSDAQGGAASSFSLRRAVPTFILLFVAAALIATVVPLPAEVTAALKMASKFLIAMAMVAIGLNTDVVRLVRTGGKPLALGACCWVAIAAVALAVQQALGLW